MKRKYCNVFRQLILTTIILSIIVTEKIIDGLSEPEYHKCVRTCKTNDIMLCKYKFTLEHFVTMGRSCDHCNPNATRIQLARFPDCQCVWGDGFERGVLTINRMIPGPSIQVCKGDMIIVDVNNLMDGKDTTIHWHGLHQNGSQYYDGVPFVTQCPIHGGNMFRYKFRADKPGTHFYHSHSGVQKLDGLYGSLIVRLPKQEDPHGRRYDYDLPEHTIVISDFLHTSSSNRIPGFTDHDTGQYPESFLINGRGPFFDKLKNRESLSPYEEITVRPKERYRLRLINALGTTCDARFSIEKHSLTVLSSDGDDLVPFSVDSLVSYSGERYDVVIETSENPGAYWIQVFSEECYMNDVHQIGILRYESANLSTMKAESSSPKPTYARSLPSGKVVALCQPGLIYLPLHLDVPTLAYSTACNSSNVHDRCIMHLRSETRVDPEIVKTIPDVSLYMPYELLFYEGREPFTPNTYKHFILPPSTKPITGLIDGISFVSPHAPPLSQPDDVDSMCNSRENLPSECSNKGNCTCTHTVRVQLGDVVEIVLVDYSENRNTSLTHPFHLHGHSFHVLDFGQIAPELKISEDVMRPIIEDCYRRLGAGSIRNPPAKDTILIPHNGYAILRVKMSNPGITIDYLFMGYWFLHCHFAYHIVIGMNMILQVGERSDLPPVPKNFPKCGNFMAD